MSVIQLKVAVSMSGSIHFFWEPSWELLSLSAFSFLHDVPLMKGKLLHLLPMLKA